MPSRRTSTPTCVARAGWRMTRAPASSASPPPTRSTCPGWRASSARLIHSVGRRGGRRRRCASSSSTDAAAPTPPTPRAPRQRPAPLLAPLELEPTRSPSSRPEPHDRYRAAPGRRCNARYTFDSFVVGQSNRLAHAASLAVVDHPGQRLQPAVPVRRRRPGQDAPAARHRPRRRRQRASTSSTSRPRRSPTS